MTKIVGNKQDPTETQHHLQSTNLIHLSSHCFLKVVHSLQQPRNDLNRSSTHRGIKPGDKPTTWLHLSIRSKSRKTTLKENKISKLTMLAQQLNLLPGFLGVHEVTTFKGVK